MKANDPAMETEADLFAMCLLMPERLLRADIKKMGGIDLHDRVAIGALAKRYRVDSSVMAARIGQLMERAA